MSRTARPLILSTFAFIALVTSVEFILAQEQAAPEQRLPRPEPAVMKVEIDPRLEIVLKNWEKAGAITRKLEGKHNRLIYDFVFNVIKFSEGYFYYEAPDKGRLDLEAPRNFKKNQQAVINGKKFDVQEDTPEKWVCDGLHVIAIDDKQKTFQKFQIPPERRGQNIVDGPLPFLFGISVEKIKARYHVTLINLNENMIHLNVKPLWQQDAANWERAEIMLDAKQYLPNAIKLIHPGGNTETVYTFKDVERNPKQNLVFKLLGKGGSPFKPDLRSYKELQAPMTASEERGPVK